MRSSMIRYTAQCFSNSLLTSLEAISGRIHGISLSQILSVHSDISHSVSLTILNSISIAFHVLIQLL